MDSHHIFHLANAAGGDSGYNLYQIINLTVGMVVWAYLYALIAYRGFKYKFVQMPLVLACGNIVWEVFWGVIFQSNFEIWVMIGVIPAIFIDCLIFYGILKFNHRYISIPFYARNLKPLALFGILVYAVIWYTFKAQGLDSDGGGTSGNILNAIIVVFWCDQLFRIKDLKLMSLTVGWAKLVADFCIALFMMSVFPEKVFSYGITWIAVLFDVIYIWLYYQRRNGTGPFKNFQLPTTQPTS